jgi:glycosyltransferase involved in cell wall biosynthesis
VTGPLRRLRFWVHDPEAPSFRHRLTALVPFLEAHGFRCETERFPRRRYGTRVLERLRGLRNVDLLVVAKLKLLPGETFLVRRSVRRIAYDFDDAIYVGKPDRPGDLPDRSWFREAKFEATCRMSDLTIAGNGELAVAAKRYAGRVEVVPTGLDPSAYPRDPGTRAAGRACTIVWIGLPGNLGYLELIRPVLSRLCRETPGLTLRIISSRFPDWPEVPVEQVAWSASALAAELASADVGVMPLTDDAWTRCKSGFKLLQYMAARLPCVASTVGSNREIIGEGETGLLASDARGWLEALRALLESGERRRAMGLAGRRRVEALYDAKQIGMRVAGLYESLF